MGGGVGVLLFALKKGFFGMKMVVSSPFQRHKFWPVVQFSKGDILAFSQIQRGGIMAFFQNSDYGLLPKFRGETMALFGFLPKLTGGGSDLFPKFKGGGEEGWRLFALFVPFQKPKGKYESSQNLS